MLHGIFPPCMNFNKSIDTMQAAFRCFQLRRQYRKILWSVGVVEKAMLRWRLKRKGFRGLHLHTVETNGDQDQQSDVEEEFFRTGRKQAEDRVVRSVIRVQAMFRSKKAQEEYRRMKLALTQAKVTTNSNLSFPRVGGFVFACVFTCRTLLLLCSWNGNMIKCLVLKLTCKRRHRLVLLGCTQQFLRGKWCCFLYHLYFVNFS